MEELPKTTLKWSAREYDHKEKSNDWYWAVGIIAVCSSVVAIIYKNYIFGIFLLLGGFCMMMFGHRKPLIVENTIDESGITFGTEHYNWDKITAFNVVDMGDDMKLILKIVKNITPVIVMHTPFQDKDKMSLIITEYGVKMDEKLFEPFSHKLMDRIGY